MNLPTTPPRKMVGASVGSDGAAGYVPKPSAGDHAKMLLGDGTWAAQPSGTVPSQTNHANKFLRTDGTNASWSFTEGVARGSRPGIISAATSTAGTTQNNTGLAFGTGDLTLGTWVRLTDWTPALGHYLFNKQGSNLGINWQVLTAGTLRISMGTGATTNNYTSSVATSVTDGAWAFLAVTLDRDGNAVFYVNGAALGSPVDISGLSAQTQTSTTALEWFATNCVGTQGECWIISGLLTSTQIANIYAAGSIAPFCTYTANTTTGQNTATIGGLSFYQWLDFGQGYGPIIRDRSGNNQHALMGATGLTHAVPRNPPGLPARAPRAGMVFDGTTAARYYNSLGTGAVVGTGNEFTLWWDGILANQTDAAAGSQAMLTLSSNITTVAQAKAFGLWVNMSTGYGFNLNLYGATANDTRQFRTGDTLSKALVGERVLLVATKTTSGVRIYLGHKGDFFDITNFSTGDAIGGSPPAFTADVDGQYLIGGYRASTSVHTHTVFGARLANVAMTEAQLRTEYERGEPGPEWSYGNTNRTLGGNPTNGGNAADSFTAHSATSFTVGNTTAHDSESGWAVAGYIGSAFWRVGVSYKITYDLVLNSGSLGTAKVAIYASLSSFSTRSNAVSLVAGTGNVAILTVVEGSSPTTWSLGFTGGAQIVDYTISNVRVDVLGYTTRLRTDTAAGLTALNASKSSTNDSTDFLLSTTGVTTSPDGRTQTIRAQTTTNGNQQLFGASVIDTTKKWRIRSWVFNCSSGTPTVSLGSASGGTQYVNAMVAASGLNEVSLATRVPASANLWCNSNSTATLDHVVVLDQVD